MVAIIVCGVLSVASFFTFFFRSGKLTDDEPGLSDRVAVRLDGQVGRPDGWSDPEGAEPNPGP